MDINNMQIGFTTLISVSSAIITGVSVFFSLKNKISLIEKDISEQDLQNNILHDRISKLHTKHDDLGLEIKTFSNEIHKMEIRILQAINEIKK